MKVHIIPSEELSNERLRTIAEIITKQKGPVEFIFPKEIFDQVQDDNLQDGQENFQHNDFVPERLPWSVLFGFCEDFRRQNSKISDDELVVLLTDHGNYNDQGDEGNWFSSWDPSGKRNFFIQTSGWDNFIESKARYPITYELVTLPLFLSTCADLDEVKAMAHYDPPKGTGPRGCPWDFCGDKSQVELKFRTGDVCPDCRKKMNEKNIDPGTARQIFAILDNIRGQMLFRKQFVLTKELSRMEISRFHRTISFTDIGNTSVRLSPREITVYLFFLEHTEGVSFPYMVDFREDIKKLYMNFNDDANVARINNTVENIVTNEADALSQLISRINKRIRNAIGEEIAESYTINGKPGEVRSISLDRNLVTYS